MEQRYYCKVEGKELHFYKLGSGPALVLMHPSPHTADFLVPMAKLLATNYTVFAIDTPGYGHSEGFIHQPESIEDYTALLFKGFKQMGLERFSLYGSATGAQLAIRYALEHPEQIEHLFMDNAAHFEDELRKRILKEYFPDLNPVANGAHLDLIWHMASTIFQYFPWCFQTEEYFLNRPQPPLPVLQFIAMDYLKAGANYDWAYKVAFEHERGEYVQQLKTDTTIFRWGGSIILPYIDALLQFDLPSNVSPYHIEGDANTRMEILTNHINSLAPKELSYKAVDSLKLAEPLPAISYQKPDALPELSADGNHLKRAWQLIQDNNPSLNPLEIQACLIDWFSTT